MQRAIGLIGCVLLALSTAGASGQPAPPDAAVPPAAGVAVPAAPEAAPPAGAAQVPSAPEPAAPEPVAPVAPEAAKPAASAPPGTEMSICLLMESAARANGLPVEFFARVIWQESRFRPNAVGPVTRSGARAQGIAQFMPATAAERQLLDPFDPIQALPKSAEFLRDLRREFGNLGLAAAAYNAGPRRVREWLAGGGGMPSETRAYVQAITGASVEQWAKSGGDVDHKQQGGANCGTLMAMLKQAPNVFVQALEQRVTFGAMQPWGVQLSGGFSRDRVVTAYARLERRYAEVLAGYDASILQSRLLSRGTRPFYQVRVGTNTRAAANELCGRIRRAGGACLVLRNPRA